MKEKFIYEKEGVNGTTLEVKIPYTDENGNRKYHSKSFNTRRYSTKSEAYKTAKKYRESILCQLNTVGNLPNKKITVKDCYELTKKYYSLTLETQRKHDIRFNYLKEYQDTPITKIKALDIQMSLNEISTKSQDTIQSVFTIWRQIYHVALVNDYVFQDLTLKVQVPKSQKIVQPKSVDMPCSLDDVLRAITEYGKGSPDSELIKYAIIIMAYTGMRPSEVYALSKEDINLENMTILVNKAVGSTTNNMVAVKTTKNINSVRIIPIPEGLIPYLGKLVGFQRDPFWLLVTESGQFLNSRQHSNFIHYAMQRAGIDFRPYMLRHAFSTKLVTTNTDLRTIQELMGHRNSSMTLSYARSSDNLKRDAINKLNIE